MTTKRNDPSDYSSLDRRKKINRWSIIDFGLISSLLKIVLVNITDKVSGIVSIIITTLISIGDTVSDFAVAFTLFLSGHYQWAITVIVVDYIPSWNIFVHNVTSSKWRAFEETREKVIALLFLLISPFSMALFHLRWLLKFESSDQDTFDFLHHNARLSHILTGSFESPIQIIILLMLYITEKLDSPFKESSGCLTDSIGRRLCFGILPGVLSLLNSFSSILKASLEISEGKSFEDKLYILIYAFSNFTFRLPSMALLILFFNEWSIAVIVLILIANFIVIFRYDIEKRKDFSVFSSVVIATVSPFISSDQTNLYKRSDVQRVMSVDVENDTNRKKLSAMVSMVTTPLILMSNITLLLLLNFENDFKFSDAIKVEKESVAKILMNFFLPMGLLTMAVNYLYGMHVSKDSNMMKYFFRCTVLIFLFFGALATSGAALSEFYGKLQPKQITNQTQVEGEITNSSKYKTDKISLTVW